MQNIIPFLWFHTEAEEAMNFYVSVFKNAKAKDILYHGEAFPQGTKGSVMTATFELEGVEFVALNGNESYAKLTQANSFFVNCESADEVDMYWKKLSDGGKVMMALGEYPFSKKYGWVQDKFGVSWQLMIGTQSNPGRKIVPCLLFVNEKYGKAEEAVKLYTSIFPDSTITFMHKAPAGGPDKEGAVQFSTFQLFGETFAAMDGSGKHAFDFTAAVSYLVNCKTQKEVDTYWNALTKDGGEEVQCGWLTDKFGVSWQITPTKMLEMIKDPDAAKVKRAMEVMFTMKKLDLAALQKAFDGR